MTSSFVELPPVSGALSHSAECLLRQSLELSCRSGEALSVGGPAQPEVRLEPASEVVLVGPANSLANLTHRFIPVQKHLGCRLHSALGQVCHGRQTRRRFEDPQEVAGGYVEVSRQFLERPGMLQLCLQRLDGLGDNRMS